MRNEGTITLRGGLKARVVWDDENLASGTILLPDPIFFTYIHEETRRNAVSRASDLAPQVQDWICST